ncbi:MAG: AraC family transcriptional regulator [Pseudomonadota bacterium]
METRPYVISNYLAPHESFHFARKTLNATPPEHAHSHDFYELFLVEHGHVAHWTNGVEAVLDVGHAVFIRPNDAHRLHAANGPDCRILNILFRSESADHLVGRYNEDLSGRFFWTTDELPATYLLTGQRLDQAIRVASTLQTAPRSLSRIEEFLLTMMTRVIDLPEVAGASLPAWLVAACERAREPDVFREGAAGFVRAAGRGHEHVCRKTKEHLGVTPSAFVNKIRMEYAAKLLAGEEISVSDVADRCGIENMSHFYRVFRQHFGVTPKAYRKQHQRSPF